MNPSIGPALFADPPERRGYQAVQLCTPQLELCLTRACARSTFAERVNHLIKASWVLTNQLYRKLGSHTIMRAARGHGQGETPPNGSSAALLRLFLEPLKENFLYKWHQKNSFLLIILWVENH